MTFYQLPPWATPHAEIPVTSSANFGPFLCLALLLTIVSYFDPVGEGPAPPLLNWGLGPYLQAGEGSPPETPPDRGGEKQTNLDWKLTRGRS